MRNMSKKTWKLRVWNHMTEIQKLDLLLKRAKVPHTYGRRWPEMDRPDNQEFLPGGRHDGGEGWLTARQVTKMWRCRNATQNR